jgi:hypothetical protein
VATTGRPYDGTVNVGFTGSLILARTPLPLTDLDPLAGLEVELVGRRTDHWQLAAVPDRAQGTSGWAAALVNATTAPVLIADVSDSDAALLVADSPGGHRWSALLNALVGNGPWATATACAEAMAGIAEVVVAWAAEAGQTTTIEAVTEALSAADRDNRAADQAWRDAARAAPVDVAAVTEIVRNQVSFIEVYVLRVLATLGLAVPVQDTGSWWAHLASKADTRSP